MKNTIALITILTDDVPRLVAFYRDVLGMKPENKDGPYVEFKTQEVRFSICARSVMADATGHASYKEPCQGQNFELAFPVASPEAVDNLYKEIVKKGAKGVKEPENMPWSQRTAFFADSDGNIHELFAQLPKEK